MTLEQQKKYLTELRSFEMNIEFQKKNTDFYKNIRNLHEEKSLGWGSKESQLLRFKVLLDANKMNKQEDKILDVGCGHGDLSVFCSNYTGIDLRQESIDIAIQKYPDKRFICGSIEDINEEFDWVIASGIFMFSDKWEEHVRNEIIRLFNVCTKGISCNFLSNLTTGVIKPDMKHASISEISSLIEPITKNFCIRHDYLANDVTLYAYKNKI